jgi:hypothetical protein
MASKSPKQKTGKPPRGIDDSIFDHLGLDPIIVKQLEDQAKKQAEKEK